MLDFVDLFVKWVFSRIRRSQSIFTRTSPAFDNSYQFDQANGYQVTWTRKAPVRFAQNSSLSCVEYASAASKVLGFSCVVCA